MDDCSFDSFTRSIARATSRRQLLKGLFGGLAGGLAVLRVADGDVLGASCRGIGRRCSQHGICCTGLCDPATMQCACPVGATPCGDACRVAADFQSDPQNCGECGNQCARDACNSAACSGGVCVLVPEPGADGSACGAGGICCGGACCAAGEACVEGACQVVEVCRELAEACFSADQCCQDAPTLCEVVPQSGLNEPQCCRPRGAACSREFLDCCGTDRCAGGVCAASCHPIGLECFSDEHCCDGLFCAASSTCQPVPEICLPLLDECTAADQCCQDEPTGCADVVGCGGGRVQCCRLPGGACNNGCDCCGVDRCVDGACVVSCVDLGEDCTADEHCCVGICDQSNGRCFDPTLAVPCSNPIDQETCSLTGACQGCEIDGNCVTSCNDTDVACVTETGGANVCIITAQVEGRGCIRSSDCPTGHSCLEDCNGSRGCFPDLNPICLEPGLSE